MKRIKLLCTDGRDVHYPMDEPNVAHVKNYGPEKAHPDFIKPARRLGTKIVPPKMPHEMSDLSDPTMI